MGVIREQGAICPTDICNHIICICKITVDKLRGRLV
jgi:hypothetical protein